MSDLLAGAHLPRTQRTMTVSTTRTSHRRDPSQEVLAVLERHEPQTLADAVALPLPDHAREEHLRRAWEAYHHDRGRGWN